MEVTSYGERPRDLLALLVPFLAKQQFYQPFQRLSAKYAEGSAFFDNPDKPRGDFIVTAGRFNCIVVVYYSNPNTGPNADLSKERAYAFQLALLDFLEGLPTPRPVQREVTFGSRYCANAT